MRQVCSLGVLIALLFQPMQNLFAKQKNVICYGVLEKHSPFAKTISAKVLETINNAQDIPGLKSEEFAVLKTEILKTWRTLFKEGVLEISATDKDVRPYFVTLQAVVEHLLASELQKEVKVLKGFIHTPMPATPLCSKGEISRDLVDPSIELDPNRLFTVKARTTIVRDFLFKGGELSIIYPKEGINKRTKDQQNIYKLELNNYPNNLHDIRLDCEAIPEELIGATYLFQDQSGKTYVFAIKMTQAKDPKEIGHFGLWFGPINHPAIQMRVKAVSAYLEQYGCDVLK